MIRSLSAIVNELPATDEGESSSADDDAGSGAGVETTVRCRIRSGPMPGETAGEKTVYLVEDPYDDVGEEVALSFWMDDPARIPGIGATADHVLSMLSVPTPADLEREEFSPDESVLRRGEELLVRAVPNRGASGTVFLNVTSFVIRDPDRLISKSKLRTQERCPREYYLRYEKRVYPGDKFDTNLGQRQARFRGDAVHKITENALVDHRDRFLDGTWDADLVEQYCEEQFASEFGFRQALLVLSGAGLDARDHVVEAVTTLFTDDEFLDRLRSATTVGAEQFLSNEYGYAGRVDVLLDGVPYDIKTTHDPDDETIARHGRQIKLYLFALLLEQIQAGDSFEAAVETGQTGYLVYPNTQDDDVRFEPVSLTMDDVREFLRERNDAVGTSASAPPSTYNRDCEGCDFATEESITDEDDTLPPACTYHCQNERRWPCYESVGGTLTTECSLFDRCDQRTRYRDPDVIDHHERVRAAFQDEREARRTAKRIVDRFDDGVLVDAGYRIPSLTCAGASGAGTVIRFTTTEAVVPAFDPGEVIRLRSEDGATVHRGVYYGRTDGEYLFAPLDDSVDVTDFLSGRTFAATYSFSVESIEERYLPYLDFAQRRNGGKRRAPTAEGSDDATPASVAPEAVSDYLDRDRLFVDLPVSRSRTDHLATIVGKLVTAAYPHPDSDESGVVPEAGRRALVVGTRPDLVECAVAAQPDGDHYRLDGTGGLNAIQNDDGYHEIQSRLLASRSLVSSVQQATSTAGPGGLREFFHRLTEGAFGDRDHSENFFDVLVVLGAEDLTEPEFRFLSDVADRTVAVGDARRNGPEMLSETATEAGLGRFFAREFDRYRSFSTPEAASLQIEGEAPPALNTFYEDGPWQSIDGQVSFLGIEGDEETAIEEIELEATVAAAAGPGRRLVFDVTDTPLSPMAARELFEDRIELDATALREDSIVVLDDESLYLRSKDRLDADDPTRHQVFVRAVASEVPQFGRALLSNRIAERIVAEVVDREHPDVDVVVTPFERHASRIRRRLAEAGLEVPVRRPEALDGTIVDHAVVSFGTSNDPGIVRPPLDDPAVLYSLLASGRNLTMIGNEATLRSRDVFEQLIDEASTYAK